MLEEKGKLLHSLFLYICIIHWFLQNLYKSLSLLKYSKNYGSVDEEKLRKKPFLSLEDYFLYTDKCWSFSFRRNLNLWKSVLLEGYEEQNRIRID